MVAQKNLCVIILAAGKGTRMKSSLPKPLHSVCGLPMLAYSLQAAQQLNPDQICIVIGHGASLLQEQVTTHLAAWGISAPVVFAEQKELNGSGGAVRAAADILHDFKQVMVLNGDVPLIEAATLREMLVQFEAKRAGVSVLAMRVEDPTGYGRIVREADGSFAKIVEETETDAATAAINEVNGGMYVFV